MVLNEEEEEWIWSSVGWCRLFMRESVRPSCQPLVSVDGYDEGFAQKAIFASLLILSIRPERADLMLVNTDSAHVNSIWSRLRCLRRRL
ncbi:unnamed protein product [Toxocara canis]|uniref:Uncharacterized protein n=1 Tax=Toxocara canis TaxID=6265 RepID=A0A183UXR6_TOXCA|nr:unnamed protein product [Toxocara canis]